LFSNTDITFECSTTNFHKRVYQNKTTIEQNREKHNRMFCF
jgi:hypothetical protein